MTNQNLYNDSPLVDSTYYITIGFCPKGKKDKKIWPGQVVSGTNWLFVSVFQYFRQYIVLNMNSDWVPMYINQNWYTDQTLVDYACYVTIPCNVQLLH